MSKRFSNIEQYGARKKPRLNISRSDHNFPLSQNTGVDKEDTWGDENDDEILLLASQACEQAYSNDVSLLPDYSMCMQPGTTSTQLECEPSTSKGAFTFKKPTTSLANVVSTNLKEKCSRISSPLPRMARGNGIANERLDDDMFNDKIYKNQDPEYVYRQLLQLQEENAKLKSENGKLHEKCVTKEGETSILRTQLKTCQVAVDNVRMEKIKVQEKVQLEWTDKLTAANNQMNDLRTQLDFKNLEIISVKEKCKMLESSKVKLTQVTIAPNDFANSSRINNSLHAPTQAMTQAKRVKVATSGVQTDKTHFIKLNKTCRMSSSKLKEILPMIHQPTDKESSLLDYNEKLQRQTDYSQNRCRIFSTFHRLPSPMVKEKRRKMTISCVWEDVTCLATSEGDGLRDKFMNVLKHVQIALNEVLSQLESISARSSASFQRAMDERYIEAAGGRGRLGREALLGGRCLFKEEQAILPRRLVAILGHILESTNDLEYVKTMIDCDKRNCIDSVNINLIETISRICSLLDSTSCAVLYSGFLQSIAILLDVTTKSTITLNAKILDITKSIISSRPIPTVSGYLVRVLRNIAATEKVMGKLCVRNTTGNMKVDYDQGVLIYRKETCHLQILLKQIEALLKCVEREVLTEEAVATAEDLIDFYAVVGTEVSSQEKLRCDCQSVISHVLIYAVQICAVMLKNQPTHSPHTSNLDAICRNGVSILYQWSLQEAPARAGRRLLLLEALRGTWGDGEAHGNMLSELLSSLQPGEGAEPASLHHQVWADSFARFTIAD